MDRENETCMKMIPMDKVSDTQVRKSPMKLQPHGCQSGFVPPPTCCHLPSPFDRSSGSWWNPKFDSEVLESKYRTSYFKQTKMRFRFALIFTLFASVMWCLFFGIMRLKHYVEYLSAIAALIVTSALLLGITFTHVYNKLYMHLSLFFAALLCCLLLSAQFAYTPGDLTSVGAFCGYVGILLSLYTLFPMRLYLAIISGLIFSVVYELLLDLLLHELNRIDMIIARAVLHLCIHVIGIHIFFMTEIQRHLTFLKIGQAAIARRGLQIERQIREKMIHSLMPPSVAREVMRAKEDKDKNDDDQLTIKKFKKKKRSSEGDNKGEIIFRSFQMNQMADVSIVFADIVGFTKMSSNKTAEHLVGLLNDLFGRFDSLCTKNGCEKISTLGDCYYCVSGCPEPRPDHAKCCVEMGLGMIEAIQQFDEDNNEQVNMRVGVHTGTVLCGIVGTRRFKFDVWSNDVTLANIMESTGQPGRVHISEKSYQFLKDEYEVEEGEECVDNSTYKVLIEHYDTETSMFAVRHTEEEKTLKTYFIIGPKKSGDSQKAKTVDKSQKDVMADVNAGCGDHVALMANDVPDRDAESGGINHNDKQMTEANGVSTAALFHRRHSQTMFSSEMSLDKVGEGAKQKLSHVLDNDGASQSLPFDRTNHYAKCSSPSIFGDVSLANVSDVQRIASRHRRNSSKSDDSTASRTNENIKPDVANNRIDVNPEIKPAPSSPPSHSKNNKIYVISYKCVSDNDCNSSSKETSPNVSHQNPEHHIQSATKQNVLRRTHEPLALRLSDHMEKVGQHTDEYDHQLVQYIEEDVKNDSFFYVPPVNLCFMSFDNKNEEDHFRWSYHMDIKTQTVTSPRFHFLIETLMSAVVFVLISISCFIMFERHAVFIAVFVVAFIVEILLIVHVLTDVKIPERKAQACTTLTIILDSWLSRNLVGALLASLPAVVVFSNFSCGFLDGNNLWEDRIFCLCIVVSLLNFCNFMTLSSWFKICIIIVISVVFLVTLEVNICQVDLTYHNATDERLFTGHHPLKYEILVDIGLFLIVIISLNQSLERSHRVSYHRHFEAEKDRKRVQENRDQADWLLHNIIPKHVSEVVKRTSTYSKNHQHVGVIFATIVNFNDFYDESYAGGREYLRVLNELISDYEDLLDKPEFKDVEKIKTISSAFMAASGINEFNRSQNKHQYAHLYSLLDFCVELLNVNERFNEGIFNFDFIMNIGFNYGDVTAGVIGTTKLHYDIWGDTVNISSRMYSTGVANRIQVPENSYVLLGDMFEFEYRGLIFVKGKGDMKTYLLVKKKPDASWS